MIYVAHLDHGPGWRPEKSVFQQGPVMLEHLEAMRRLYHQRVLLLGGPYDRRGGIAVLTADTAAEATQIIDRDPAVAAGVLTHRIEHLNAYFDRFHGTELRTRQTTKDQP